jgi:putative ABC transport system ATP-binding protein
MSNFFIKAEGLTKSYDRIVINNLDFSIKKGAFISILGKSGSGKSTLLHILGGLLKPDSGKVYCEDQNVYSDPEIYRRKKVGFVFQFFHLIASLTVYENIILPLKLLSHIPDETKLPSLFEKFNIKKLLNSYPKTLSGGEKQRVAIARALSKTPDILFCDEPTANLDRENAEFVFDSIKDFNRNGGTVLIVTHDLSMLYGETYNLENGKLRKI